MTTPFDTTRLDEECERIAGAIALDNTDNHNPLPYQVKAALLATFGAPSSACCKQIFDLCRRPKMVKA